MGKLFRKTKKFRRTFRYICFAALALAIILTKCGIPILNERSIDATVELIGIIKDSAENLIISSTTANASEGSDVNDTYLNGPYKVDRVVDGDTIIVAINGENVTVRMIGVNTPESVAPENYKENTDEGVTASDYTKELLTGEYVHLEYDKDKDDNYGRTLAYVYLDDVMVNLHLLEEGYAEVMTIKPNTKYVAKFQETEQKAKENNIGFWSNGRFANE